MASRTSSGLLLLALVGALVFLQVAQASENGLGRVGDVGITDIDVDSESTPWDEQFEDVSGDQLPDSMSDLRSEREVQPYLYVPGADEDRMFQSGDEELADEVPEGTSPAVAYSLARVLREGSSMRCWWGVQRCYRFFKKPGCCRKTCVNFVDNNNNCGRCERFCDTRNGYFCHSMQCRKRPPPQKSCSKTTSCPFGKTCCGGKCVDARSDVKNCGVCGKKCVWGSACCGGKCKNLKSDCFNCGQCGGKCAKGHACCSGRCTDLSRDVSNCGRCGKSCGWGRQCCKGVCKNTQWDCDNCGGCGKKCAKNVKCTFGTCGYNSPP